MRQTAHALAALLCALPPAVPAQDAAPRFKSSLELRSEATAFLHDGAYPQQHGDSASLAAEAELDWSWGSYTRVTLTPFARWDAHDEERTHFDLREFAFRHRVGRLDLLAGISRVFWGRLESAHLVDIVNQTDLVEDPDGEDKLGQPMLSVSWSARWGRLESFLLPGFRPQLLPGRDGRFRAPLPYSRDEPLYESGAEARHVDAALRYSLTHGPFDFGLAHFDGTARDPDFLPALDDGAPALRPYYPQIRQTSLDASAVFGGWLLKLEALHRHRREGHHAAAGGGFEYTLTGIAGSGWDLGLLSEYLWDERGADGASPFQNDVFVGARLSGNDIAGSELLAGVIRDLDHRAHFASVEASRRIGASSRLALQLRLLGSRDDNDPLRSLREDDYARLEYTRYF